MIKILFPGGDVKEFAFEGKSLIEIISSIDPKILNSVVAAKVEEINRALAHRPINGASAAHADFKSKLLLKIEAVKEKNHFFNFSNEIEQCRIQ